MIATLIIATVAATAQPRQFDLDVPTTTVVATLKITVEPSSGAMWHGKWDTKGNTLCADWKERPNNPCTRWDKTGETITILDSVSGQTRAKVVKTAPGNSEKLSP